jgi:predicted GIY-YIG superfamily endonuclease
MNKESGIYLIYLGNFKNLKDKLNILNSPLVKYRSFNDNDGIYKFGKTNDLKKRINQHKNHYEKVLGQRSIFEDFKLISFSKIEEQSLTSCENKVKEFCLNKNYHFIEESSNKETKQKYNELVIIKEEKINEIIEFYQLL